LKGREVSSWGRRLPIFSDIGDIVPPWAVGGAFIRDRHLANGLEADLSYGESEGGVGSNNLESTCLMLTAKVASTER